MFKGRQIILSEKFLFIFSQWRDFAKEVDGLLRIGAVNCGDDRMLCRMKGVNSYPSLFIFRSGMVRGKVGIF